MLEIKYDLVKVKKEKPDWDKLGFGKYFTDHMFIMDYDEGQGWHDARIVPYQNLSLDPACMVFHYAQEMFEGLKAYRTPNGEIQLFRPQKNIERMNKTNERLCIPQVDPDETLDAIKAVVEVDPAKIVYVSCDPATLARDIKFLTANGYDFVEATPCDMFPWTGHCEVVSLLVKVHNL